MISSDVRGVVTQTAGYFAVGCEVLGAWLGEGLGDGWRVRVGSWGTVDDVVADLEPAIPLSRYACVGVGAWTVLLNNGPLGTDVGVLPSRAARELGCRAIRATCVPDGASYPARILEVYGPGGAAPLALERAIVAVDDGGRWVFEVEGEPYAFEDLGNYRKHVKSHRFTCEMVDDYLEQLGVPVDTKPDWTSGLLVERVS